MLFTFHAYGTWMPDRPQGYHRNRAGLRAPDPAAADVYRRRQREPQACLIADVQRALLQEAIIASGFQRFRLFAASTDDSHCHLLTGWDGLRSPEQVQRKVKESLTRRLNRDRGSRRWFGRDGHDRRVRGPEHYVYLRDDYLPGHRGWRWDHRFGWTPPREG